MVIDMDDENIIQLDQHFFELEIKLDDEINFNDDSIMCYGIALPFHNRYNIKMSEWQQLLKLQSRSENDEITNKLELCHYKV